MRGNRRGAWLPSDRKSHHLLSAAVAGAAGVAGQPGLAAVGTAVRPIHKRQGRQLLEGTDSDIIGLNRTCSNIQRPIAGGF